MRWNELKQLVLERFCSRSEVENMEINFLKLEPGNMTYREYTSRYNEMSRLVPDQVNTEEKRVRRYIQGFPSKIRKLIKPLAPRTFQAAMDVSSGMYDEEYGEGGRPDDKKRKFSDEKKEESGANKRHDSGKGRKCSKCGRNHRGRCQSKEMTCYNYGKVGHYSRNCLEPKRELKCYNCGKTGHAAPNCNEKRKAGCYNCGDTGHLRANCPKLVQNPTPIQMIPPRGGEMVKAKGRAFTMTTEEARMEPDVVTGPGCSSMIGAMSELGPFRINSDGNTLFMNDYAWSNVANMLFLESPAGVGFSYSNTTSDYDKSGDKNTADDAYIFLVNWLERFPQYKTRAFYITGESYAGHYVPQLAYTILLNNKKTNQTIINIAGIAIGNAVIDEEMHWKGKFDHWWSHAIISDATHDAILKYCDFASNSSSAMCDNVTDKAWNEIGEIDVYNIYAPICLTPRQRNTSAIPGSINFFDPCWQYILEFYLNDSMVQKALHAKPTSWDLCSDVIKGWNDRADTILPIIKYLIANGQRIWVFSGDVDGQVPTASSRYSINALNLPIETAWRSWYLNKEVGGYLEAYKGLLLITVRGAGHTVPSYQPQRALALFTSFLEGTLPPSS